MAELFFDHYWVEFQLYWEERKLKKEIQKRAQQEGSQVSEQEVTTPSIERPWIEEQAKYVDMDTKNEIENILRLVIGLGYVLLFGAIVPFVVPLCFAVFATRQKCLALSLTSNHQRPVPRMTRGIGSVESVVQLLMGGGILMTGFLLVTYGVSFKKAEMLARVSWVLLYLLIAYCCYVIISFILPEEDSITKLLRARHQRVLHKISFNFGGQHETNEKIARHPDKQQAIQGEEWDEIPYYKDMPQPNRSFM